MFTPSTWNWFAVTPFHVNNWIWDSLWMICLWPCLLPSSAIKLMTETATISYVWNVNIHSIFWLLSSIAHFSTNPNTNAKTQFMTPPLTSPVTIICYQISNWDCNFSQYVSDNLLCMCQFSWLVSQCIHNPIPCSLLEQHSLHQVASMTLIVHIVNNSFIFIVQCSSRLFLEPP